MILTGFTDEAGNDLETQIAVTKELGWDFLSARTVGADNIHEISERDFDIAYEKLANSGLQVAEFGTLIGNWGKSIESDWQITEQEMDRCIPRMQKLGVKYARIMSYAQKPWGQDQNEKERFSRLRKITARFKDAGLEALHENCMNWGGFSSDHTLRLLEEVPGLRLVFDTGNPVFQQDRSKGEPFPWQNSLEFYSKVKHRIAHVHVKDAILDAQMGNEPRYTFAGEGDGFVREILEQLISEEYDGFVAIEPHLGKVFHSNDPTGNPDELKQLYLEYGRKFQKLLNDLKH